MIPLADGTHRIRGVFHQIVNRAGVVIASGLAVENLHFEAIVLNVEAGRAFNDHIRTITPLFVLGLILKSSCKTKFVHNRS
jgi:hypothetical protein